MAERFWRHVNKNGPIPTHRPELGPCWLWTGGRHRRSGQERYGLMKLDHTGASVGAHRASWKIHNGPVPEGMVVCHRCDVMLCVRPDHLFLGTQLENMADAVDKDRQCRGERNSHAKLTAADVLDIRAKHAAGPLNVEAEAVRRGVSLTAIYNIICRKTWRHL